MTKKNMHAHIDRLLIKIAEVNEIPLDDPVTVTATQTLLVLALKKLEEDILQAATASNRIRPAKLVG